MATVDNTGFIGQFSDLADLTSNFQNVVGTDKATPVNGAQVIVNDAAGINDIDGMTISGGRWLCFWDGVNWVGSSIIEKVSATSNVSSGLLSGAQVYIHPTLDGNDITFDASDQSINSTTTDFNVLLNNAQQSLVLVGLNIDTITFVGTLATVTTQSATHRLETGQLVSVFEADFPEYNVVDEAITVIAPNQFTYNMAATPAGNSGPCRLESNHLYSTGAPLLGEETITITGANNPSNDGVRTITSVSANKITVSSGVITDAVPSASTEVKATWRMGFTDGNAILVNKDDILNPTSTNVSWAYPTLSSFRSQAIGATVGPDYFIDENFNPVEVYTTRRSPEQYRDYLGIGRIGVSNVATTTPVSLPVLYGDNMAETMQDLLLTTGSLLDSGCALSFSATNPNRLSIGSGTIFRWKAGYRADPLNPENRKNPHRADIPFDPEDVPFGYSTNGQSWYNPTNNPQSIPEIAAQEIDLVRYWDGASLVLVPSSKRWHVQEVWYFAVSNVSVIRYAQQTFASKAEAESGIQTSFPVIDPPLNESKNAVIIGYIVIDSSTAVDLTNPASVTFLRPLR